MIIDNVQFETLIFESFKQKAALVKRYQREDPNWKSEKTSRMFVVGDRRLYVQQIYRRIP